MPNSRETATINLCFRKVETPGGVTVVAACGPPEDPDRVFLAQIDYGALAVDGELLKELNQVFARHLQRRFAILHGIDPKTLPMRITEAKPCNAFDRTPVLADGEDAEELSTDLCACNHRRIDHADLVGYCMSCPRTASPPPTLAKGVH